jgi:N-acetylglucosamine kinase-like BadF-type ATPase
MILIADSGSTNTSWCLIPNNEGIERVLFTTEGYNPYFVTQDYIVESLRKNLPESYDWNQVQKVGFYGAGCSENKYEFIRDSLKVIFKNADIDVAMDLHAAARALLGNKSGFAAILGTGTNSCTYDGESIVKNIDSLGFILGDEGSGAYTGRKLLRDYLRGDMPQEIEKLFIETYKTSAEEIFENVYEKPFPNKYCASFCPFIREHLRYSSWLENMVKDSFRDMFRNIITKYPNYQDYKFNCVGSIAFHFKSTLAEICSEFGMPIGIILQSPVDGLVDYYKRKTMPKISCK